MSGTYIYNFPCMDVITLGHHKAKILFILNSKVSRHAYGSQKLSYFHFTMQHVLVPSL
jgi:glutamine amidotransferase PdxT